MGFPRMVSAGMFCLFSWGWGLPHPARYHIWGSHLHLADGSPSSPALMARGAARSGPVMAIPGSPGEESGEGPKQPVCFPPGRPHTPLSLSLPKRTAVRRPGTRGRWCWEKAKIWSCCLLLIGHPVPRTLDLCPSSFSFFSSGSSVSAKE